MKENDEFILDIKRLGINGEGIGFYNKLAVFVENAIPGEGHNVRITKDLGKMAFAKSLEIKTKSRFRVDAKCPYYNECGGCNVMHIDYTKMLDFKKEQLVEALNRFTTLNVRQFEIRDVIPSNNQLGYRNRSNLPIRREAGTTSIAMVKPNSNITISIDKCIVQNDIINKLNNEIVKLIEETKTPLFMKKYDTDGLKNIALRTNSKGDSLVTLISSVESNKVNNLANKVSELNNVIGVYVLVQNDKSKNPFDGDLKHIAGKKYVTEVVNKMGFRLYPDTFFYLNTESVKTLSEIVLKAARLSHKENVLCINALSGVMPSIVSTMAGNILAIDNDDKNISLAKENQKNNNITNITFENKSIKDALASNTFDEIVIDSPKSGLDDKDIKLIAESNVKKLVYISPNPASLAKNLEVLKDKYKIKYITPIDMAPQTANLCCVVALELK